MFTILSLFRSLTPTGGATYPHWAAGAMLMFAPLTPSRSFSIDGEQHPQWTAPPGRQHAPGPRADPSAGSILARIREGTITRGFRQRWRAE